MRGGGRAKTQDTDHAPTICPHLSLSLSFFLSFSLSLSLSSLSRSLALASLVHLTCCGLVKGEDGASGQARHVKVLLELEHVCGEETSVPAVREGNKAREQRRAKGRAALDESQE
jgi:hypothetical protein